MKKILTLFFLIVSFIASPVFAQFSGTYYVGAAGTRPSGGDPDYLSLKSAMDAVNAGTITGNCTFYITSDLIETANVGLGVNTAGYTIIIKPADDLTTKTITFTQATDNTGPSGGFVIGISNLTAWTNLITTDNIIVDGYADGGSTKRLVWKSDAAAYYTTGPISVAGNSNNITLKNFVVTHEAVASVGTSNVYAIAVRVRNASSVNYVPDTITIDNCDVTILSSATTNGIGVTNSGTPTEKATNIIIKNNNISSRNRGIFLNYGTSFEVSGNSIQLNQTTSGYASSAIAGNSGNTGTHNVFNNKITQLITANTAGAGNGIRGIQASGGGTYNIYNNFITGFSTPATGTTEVVGIRAGVGCNIYHNTIVIDNVATTGPGTTPTAGIVTYTASCNIRDNIIITNEDDFASYCLYGAPIATTSDYNLLYTTGTVNAKIGFNTTAQATLADWQTSTGQDAHSVSSAVTFVSPTDLHLAEASWKDANLAGTKVGILTDIDNKLRDPIAPYKGAHEGPSFGIVKGDIYVGNAGTAPGATNPEFALLKDAFDYLNKATFSDNVNLYITSDITEPYTGSVGIGLAVNPDPYTLTIKPYTGVQPVVTFNYPTDLNAGPSGAFIIGIPGAGNVSWDSLRATKNIVIDGSNTVGGTTRDLTLQTATTAQRNAFPIVIVGDVSNVTVKNSNIFYKVQTVSTSGNLFLSGIQIRSRNYLSKDWVPRNITIDNNHISSNFDGVAEAAQAIGYYQSGTPVPSMFPYNITIKNNLLEGKRRGIALYQAGSTDIFNNEIILNQNITSTKTNEAIYAVAVSAGSVVNIYNNKISKLSSMSNTSTYGNTGISIESNGTYNVYNNMITGFELTAANPTAYLTGIKNSSTTDTLNCYFNTIMMNDIADIGTGTVAYKGLLISNGTNDVKNNIVFSNEPNFVNYCFSREGVAGTLTSNYNDLFVQDNVNGKVGYWNATAAPTLADWQTASTQDANSKSVFVNFKSATDLHLALASDGDLNLIGTPLASVLTDIDGDIRHLTYPYIGADESNTPLPVELTSFTASAKGNVVELTWQTATEKNSAYFEVQRKADKDSWTTIGKVNAAGTTTEKARYSFTEKDVKCAVAYYRLKMVDLDGSYSYSKEVEAKVDLPVKFELSQNYPNPFNPATIIRYALPVDSKVRLEIYSMLGELVTTLVNDLQPAGNYSVAFDASRYASGTYIYRLTAGTTVMTKKMLLIK